MENRRGKRYKVRLKVRYGLETPDTVGFLEDISSTGVRIKTNVVFKPGSTIKIEIVDEARHQILIVEGLVRWARKVPPAMVRTERCGMGIAFLKIDANMHQFLLDLKNKHEGSG